MLARKNEGGGGERDDENILLRPQSDRCMETSEQTIRYDNQMAKGQEPVVSYQVPYLTIVILDTGKEKKKKN